MSTTSILLAVLIPWCSLAFGGGVWIARLGNKFKRIEDSLTPLIILHKKEILAYYLEKGILPNPGMPPRKRYLIERLEASTLSFSEAQELSNILRREEGEARRSGNNDALIAILGLIALVAIIAALARR
jgi:hypothetical protein